jgi:hypothetical protein
MTKHPISDRAEIALDFPEKTYMGSFTRHSSYEADADPEGVQIKLSRSGGDKREIDIHLHYHLFADILTDLAKDFENGMNLDEIHKNHVRTAVQRLAAALDGKE